MSDYDPEYIARYNPDQAAIRADERRKKAELIRRELVCCEVFDGSGEYPDHHAICYWGEAAARLVEEDDD